MIILKQCSAYVSLPSYFFVVLQVFINTQLHTYRTEKHEPSDSSHASAATFHHKDLVRICQQDQFQKQMKAGAMKPGGIHHLMMSRVKLLVWAWISCVTMRSLIFTSCKNTWPWYRSLVNQDYGVFTHCMQKESGLWCALVQCENDSCSRWLFVCVHLLIGTAICVCHIEPEDVNVQLLWPKFVV